MAPLTREPKPLGRAAADAGVEPARPAFAGLSSAEAGSLRAKFGPNAVVEEPIHPLKRFALHFWAPVPWMLEGGIALQLFLGEWLTASTFNL